MVDINPQIKLVKESATLAINQKVQQLRSTGKAVCHLGFGQAPFDVAVEIQQSLKLHAGEKNYLPGSGLPVLCQAVANYYQSEFDYAFQAGDVLIGPGSKELLYQLLYLLTGPVLIPAASWVSYGPQVTLLDKQYHIIDTLEKDGYCLQADALEKTCSMLDQANGSNQQKILIINSPNNPTGSVYSKETLQALAVVCKKNNVVVISDEIYANINFTNKPHASLAHFFPEGTIVTGGLSKLFSAGGYRLGVCLIPSNMDVLYSAMKIMISETFSCVSGPIQYAAYTAYHDYQTIKPYLMDCVKVHEMAGKYLHGRFTAMGLSCPEPQGAFYLFPNFASYAKPLNALGINTSVEMAEAMLDNAQVAMLPGEDFYRAADELTCRVATTDYNGPSALKAYQNGNDVDSIISQCMPGLIDGCDRLEKWLKSL